MLLLLFFIVAVTFTNASDPKSDIANLDDPAWQELIAEGGLHVGSGRTKRFVELYQNQPNIPHQACLLPNGKSGHCRHLHHCVQEEFKTDFTKFMDYFCIIKRSAIGVCCPDDHNVAEDIGLAGDLPATAPKEEKNDVITKIVRAENRGCGLSTRAQGKFIDSQPADPREWPWMASITPKIYELRCGGALITDRHVLTAAHCVWSWKVQDLNVRLGEYDFASKDDSRTYDFRVVEKRQHEDYQQDNYLHDMAILKLHRPAVFNSYVWPICLPPLGLDLVNKTAILIGWGTQSFGGPYSDILMEVAVPVWDHEKCIDAFVERIFEESLCAGAYKGGKDACQGDSGGPLMYQMESGRWVVIGVVSWGVRCGEPNHPGVYTRVDRYLPWIIDNSRF